MKKNAKHLSGINFITVKKCPDSFRIRAFLDWCLKAGKYPPGSTGGRKSFHMRLSEGKHILESKRLNEKAI